MAGHCRAHAGAPPGLRPRPLSDPVPGPRPDAFAALLGIEVEGRGPGHIVAVLTTDERHANPHGTVQAG